MTAKILSEGFKKISVERYIAEDPMLCQLQKDYPWLVRRMVTERFPVAAGRKLGEEYAYKLSRIDPFLELPERSRAEQKVRKQIRRLYEKVSAYTHQTENKDLPSNRVMDIIKTEIEMIDQNERIQYYNNSQRDRLVNLKQKVQNEHIIKTRRTLEKFQKNLENFERKLFQRTDEQNLNTTTRPSKIWHYFVSCNIERSEIDRTIEISSRISRNLLADYLNEYVSNSREEIWRYFPDAKYWREKWWHLRDDYFDKEPNPIGYIYIMANKFMPGLVKIGKSIDPIRRAKQLSGQKGAEGVPGNFSVEYARETAILKTFKNLSIEKHIHHNLMVRLREDGHVDENSNEDLLEKEFFIVPSLKYAILFVEEQIDNFERFLVRVKYENQISESASE